MFVASAIFYRSNVHVAPPVSFPFCLCRFATEDVALVAQPARCKEGRLEMSRLETNKTIPYPNLTKPNLSLT